MAQKSLSKTKYRPELDKSLYFMIYYSKRPTTLTPMATFVGRMSGQISHVSHKHQCSGGTIRTVIINSSDKHMNQTAEDIRRSPDLMVVSVATDEAMAVVMGESGGAFIFATNSVLKVRANRIVCKADTNINRWTINGVNELTVKKGRLVIVINGSEEVSVISYSDSDYILRPLVHDVNRCKRTDNHRMSQSMASQPQPKNSRNRQTIMNPLVKTSPQVMLKKKKCLPDVEVYDYQPIPERLCRSEPTFLPLLRKRTIRVTDN